MYSKKTLFICSTFSWWCGNNEKFWLELRRNTEDYDAGIGKSKFIFGTGKYKELIGTECIYAVKLLDESAFSKHKCELK